VSLLIGVCPTISWRKIKKVCEQTVRIAFLVAQRIQDAGAFKLSKTFKFISRKPSQKIQQRISAGRDYIPEESTNERRARGYDDQKLLPGTNVYVPLLCRVQRWNASVSGKVPPI